MPEFLNSITERIKDSATVRSVYGDPIVTNEKTIIPVARIICGFGGGSGKKVGEANQAKAKAGVAA